MTSSNNLSSLKELVSGMLRSQRLAVLGTCGKEGAYCSLIAFAGADDLKTLLLATQRATHKYFNILLNPAVSLLIDTRTNTAEDFRNAAAITAIGKAAEVTGPERERYKAAYLDKQPELGDFVGSPQCALIRVNVKTYRVVTRFQEVMELPVGD